MGCFDNLIGIKSQCGTVTDPSSGLWIDQLHGISVQNADATISQDYETGIQLIEDKIALAQKMVSNEVYQKIQGKISAVPFIENDSVGHYDDNLPVLAADAGYYRGIQYKIEGSQYTEAFISSVRFQPQVAGTYDVKVIDLISGLVLDTKQIVTTSNNEIGEAYLNKSYLLNKGRLNLFIGVESTATYKTGLHSTYKGCSNCGGWPKYTNKYATIRGAKLPTSGSFIDSNLSSLNNTAGLSITYTLGCSMDAFLCSISNRMAFPILYKTGELILAEMMYSKRLNSVISLYGKEHAELRAEYDNEYNKSLYALLENMKLPNDICFRCNPRIKHVIQIP